VPAPEPAPATDRFPDDTTEFAGSLPDYIDRSENELKLEKKQYETLITSASPTSFVDKPINSAFNSAKYKIVENGGRGDCFFESVQQAFETIGIDIPIEKQRNILADTADADVFERYQILSSASDLDEYTFKQSINTLDEFKAYIKTQNFWADEYAISVLQKHFNISFIVLLENKYSRDDILRMINCGIIEDDAGVSKDIRPAYYVILTLGGAHYRVVKYDDRAVFTYDELPYAIKKFIVAGCLINARGETLTRRDNSYFSQVPRFRQLRDAMIEEETVLTVLLEEQRRRGMLGGVKTHTGQTRKNVRGQGRLRLNKSRKIRK
jgi:hypothetical protein